MAQGPSLGNPLGFALLLRDRRALLAVDRRPLAPGIGLVDYEALVPNVQFPITPPVAARSFRHRRCHVLRMSLEIELHSLVAWLAARLVGRVISGIRIESVAFEPAGRAHLSGPTAPWLVLGGRTRTGASHWYGAALGLRAERRAVVVWPTHRWTFGRTELDADGFWADIARAFDPKRRATNAAVEIDAALEAVRIPFVRAGWKVPALQNLALVGLTVDERRISASWRAGGTPWLVTPDEEPIDVVPAIADRVRTSMTRGDREQACHEIASLAAAAASLPAAHAAALRWGFELATHDRKTRIAFARARVKLQPADSGARRDLVCALAGNDNEELLRMLPAWGQLAPTPEHAARCEIANACGLAERGQFAAARATITAASELLLPDVIAVLRPMWMLDDPEAALAAAEVTFGEAPVVARRGHWCDLALAAAEVATAEATTLAWESIARAATGGPDDRWETTACALIERLSPDEERLSWLGELADRHGGTSLAAAVTDARPQPTAPAVLDVPGWLREIDEASTLGDLTLVVSLVDRMLGEIAMGPEAYAAIATRGIDAAIAQGDLVGAMRLLDAAILRSPDHPGLSRVRHELLAVAGDPRLRAQLLGTIARRATGAARIEALDERARLLLDELGDADAAAIELANAFAEAPQRLDLAMRLADAYTRRKRWAELASVLAQVFGRQRDGERRGTLLRLCAVYRDGLGDLGRAEQALRLALATLPDGDPEREPLFEDLVELLDRQGRWSDLAHELEVMLGEELAGRVAPVGRRAALLGQLCRLQREVLGEEAASIRGLEALERVGLLPDDGLAPLAHAWRTAKRHDDLVRLLDARALTLRDDPTRYAAARLRAAELLDGPLGRPLDAVDRYLDAYLVDPGAAGPRLRVLLAGVVPLEVARARLMERIATSPESASAAWWSLLASVLANHPAHTDEAAGCYREALVRLPDDGEANLGLARLELRRGDIAAAWPRLCTAVRHTDLLPTVRADLAAAASRLLMRANNDGAAMSLIEAALAVAPDHAAALLERARLLERAGSITDLIVTLDHLREVAMPGAMRAEVLFRHASTMAEVVREQPHGEAAERAIADVLEALRADPTHPGARQLLLEIARLRDEWSLVVAALEAVLRTLGHGPARARVELEIAEVCATGGEYGDAAVRLAAAAIEIDDDEVHARVCALALRLQPSNDVIDRLAGVFDGNTRDPSPAARARIDRLVARLRQGEGDQGYHRAGDASSDVPAVVAFEAGDGRGWLDVAANAWRRLGDGERAAKAVLHALAEPHDEARAARIIADVALACRPATAEHLYLALMRRGDHIAPALRLQRASLARLLGQEADALADLSALTPCDEAEVRRAAFAEISQILARVGSPEERRGVLRARLNNLGQQDPAEIADVAGELAIVERDLGDPTRALVTCRLGLAAGPHHRTLLRLAVELLELHDLPEELIDALQRYAMVCASPRERARQLVRAARIVLDRGAAETALEPRMRAADRAAALLARAREADADDVAARSLALPLAFAAGRHDEVDGLARWLIARGRREDPALVLGAISEARHSGSVELAGNLGQRDLSVVDGTLLPALRQAATELATVGPASHIDAVLAAAARICGGPIALFDAVRRWSSDRPLQAGLAFALSRLQEMHGDPKVARMLLQIAGFLARGGALESWIEARVAPDERALEVDDEPNPLGGHGGLRALLRASVAQRTDAWVNVVAPDAAMSADERRFREMHAHLGRFSGLASLLDGDDADLADRLDALATLANPEHRTTGLGAGRLAEGLGQRTRTLPVTTKVAALDEIAHWLTSPDHVARLRQELVRHWWLVATRRSQELRGALFTLADAIGTRSPTALDAPATLRHDEAKWLLRALGLYAAEARPPVRD